ncbi:MAG: helix-turn-helix transcriptional regulator, partial [Oscillospiraceae bacterium]|nr:helix-turn-helix transcriptional regulator [Oscillospiraceae bacterium]
MLQMAKIGAYIARLRKANGLTQGKLADKLSVSHQAVSNWERGDSLPDASQWIPLSRTLGTSVDLLLYGGELPEDDRSSEAEEIEPPVEAHIKEDAAVADEPKAASSFEHIWSFGNGGDEDEDDEDEDDDEDDDEEEDEEDEDDDEDESDDDDLDCDLDDDIDDDGGFWEQIASFAPHMSRDGLARLVSDPSVKEKPDWNTVRKLAPFLPREALDKLAINACTSFYAAPQGTSQCSQSPDFDQVVKLAPFMSRQGLDYIVAMVAKSERIDFDVLKKLAPFLSRETVAALVDGALKFEHPDFDGLIKLAPFMSKQDAARIMSAALSGRTPNMRVVRKLTPFVPRDMLDELVFHAAQKKTWKPEDSAYSAKRGDNQQFKDIFGKNVNWQSGEWQAEAKQVFDAIGQQ